MYVNHSFAAWLGYAQEELIDQPAARFVAENEVCLLVILSLRGQITDVNKPTEHATGKSREQLIGIDFFNYFTEPPMAREGIDGYPPRAP